MSSLGQLHKTLKPRQKIQYVVVAQIIFDVNCNCMAYYLPLCLLKIQHVLYSTFLFFAYPMSTISANFSNLAEKWSEILLAKIDQESDITDKGPTYQKAKKR